MTSTTDLVGKIHASARPLVLSVTGGGSRAISALLEVPGASRTVLEAIVPYSAAALGDWLGAQPEHFCCERTARAMAMAAYQRARELAQPEPLAAQPLALTGAACTASLASDRPKRGAHRLHAAVQTEQMTLAHSLELIKGRRSRFEEEQLVAAVILNLIAQTCDIGERIEIDLAPEEQIVETCTQAPQAWQDLLAGRIACAVAQGQPATAIYFGASVPRRAVFAGAFNPRHAGHLRMAQVAAGLLGVPVEFEISILNVDKPPLDFTELHERAAQFDPGETLWFTRAATFLEKAAIFAPATFVVGADTIARIADARYYAGEAGCAQAIAQLAASGCRFLVFGRHLAGRFVSLAQLQLPAALRQICDEIPEPAFRLDISSTDLRRSDAADD